MLTIKDILDLEVMNEAKVRTGKEILHKQMVKSVSVIEIPVENFVRPDEIVLSTGIGCGHDSELLEEFVKDVFASNPAALALATGRYISEIPGNVISLAQDNGFPIIEVPWKLRFADITQTILEALNDRRQKELEQSEKVQQQLLNLILHGGNLSGIAQFIYEKTKKPAIIVNRNGIVKGTSHGSQSLIENWKKHPPFRQTDNLAAASDKTEKRSGILQTPIRSAGSIQGIVLVELQGSVSLQTTVLLEHAATAAGLWFLRENAVEETETRLHGDFVWSLAKGELDESWDMIRSRARSLQIDIDLPYVCLLGKIENDSTSSTSERLQKNTIGHVEQQIISLRNFMKRKVIVTCRQETLIVFLEVNSQSVTETVHSFFRQLEENLAGMSPQPTMSWGIGENHAGVRRFPESFRAARTALEVGRKQKGPGHQTTYGDTRLYRALLQLSANEEMRNIAQEVIGQLVRYSQDKDIDLVQTFEAYVRHKGNISQTARALHLHRQSLVYRLQKIKSLTGHSFDDPDDLFLIHLCIKLWTTGMSGDS